MQNMIPNRKEKGFTLIELVMVIVILGILAAFALPRFADFSGDARTASVQALGGAMKSASSIAHAKLLAKGTSSAIEVTLEGQPIAMSDGYPTADTGGIILAAQVDAGSTIDSDNDYWYSETGAQMTLMPSGVASAANCKVVYEAAVPAQEAVTGTNEALAVNYAPAKVTVTTTGCSS